MSAGSVTYDKGADVLYMSFSDAAKAKHQACEEIGPLLIRWDTKTNQVVGVTVLDFSFAIRMLGRVLEGMKYEKRTF